MKKLFLYGALAAAALSFNACSSDDSVADVQGNGDNGGGNYITIGINLPQTSTTRAAATDNGGNVTYDDGMASEYAVNDAVLLIFDGDNKFLSAYNLTTLPWTDSGDDTEDVTQYSTRVVQKVNAGVKADDQLLVILNANSVIPTFTDGAASITVGDKTITTSSTYADVAAATVTATTLLEEPGQSTSVLNRKGFLMANAPLANAAGSYSGETKPEATVRLLVPITATYNTQAEAYSATTVDQIYVERALAKVTFDNTAATGEDANLSASKIGTQKLSWTVKSWILDNTNKTSYVVRNFTDISVAEGVDFTDLKSPKTGGIYRYIGNQQITFPSSQTYGYRTYFAKDPNYDADATFNRVAAATTFSEAFGEQNPQYCFENTFDVEHQNVNQTTLVQVAVQAVPVPTSGTATPEDLYTLGTNKTMVYTNETLKAFIKQKAYEYLQTANAFNATEGSTSSADITDVTLNLDDAADAGVDGIAKLEINEDLYTHLKTGFAKTEDSKYYLNMEVNDDATTTDVDESVYGVGTHTAALIGAITKYANGISYYNIRIKHFGDKLTPWNNGEYASGKEPGGDNGIYPDNDANKYLGRYGVLRNNWYRLQITKVRLLGEAVPHTDDWPGTPDDELDTYITFQINVLSWAKHDIQETEL